MKMDVFSVLVAVTGEQCDGEAVRLACELLDAQRGNLQILYVIEVERGLPVDAEIASSTAQGEEVLKQLERVANNYRCETEGQLVQARRAGSAVVQQAVDRDVDTIVLALPYTERYGAFSLGETVPYVLKNAPCRVIVWREPLANLLEDGAGR